MAVTDSRVTSTSKTDSACLSVYFAAGISMTKKNDVYRAAMKDLEHRCNCEGMQSVRVNSFYPYGYIDEVPISRHRRFILLQAAVVFEDMLSTAPRTSGGRSLFYDVRKDYDAGGGGNIVLIGHSGGGVASYKAGLLLEEAGYPVSGIFMVGSPKIPIRKSFQDRVYALEHDGRWGDLVCRIGFHLFKRPRDRVRLPIVDGHPSYFCNESKDENNVSNMSKVLDTIWGWMQPTVR